MTCRHALLLLEDYADNELSLKKAEDLRIHLESCPICRKEHDDIRRLKELLTQRPAYNPGEDYWSETSSIILARTVESSPWKNIPLSVAEKEYLQRSNFIRSLVSVLASLIILFSAIFIGSTQNQKLVRFDSSEIPVFAVASIEKLIGSDNTVIVTRDERLNQVKGMILIGSPGMLGRFSALFDYNNLVNKL